MAAPPKRQARPSLPRTPMISASASTSVSTSAAREAERLQHRDLRAAFAHGHAHRVRGDEQDREGHGHADRVEQQRQVAGHRDEAGQEARFGFRLRLRVGCSRTARRSRLAMAAALLGIVDPHGVGAGADALSVVS